MVGEPAAEKQTDPRHALAPSSVEARTRGRDAPDLLARSRSSGCTAPRRSEASFAIARGPDGDRHGRRDAAAPRATIAPPPYAPGRRRCPDASVPLPALPGPAVLVVRVAGLEEVQAGLADEDPRTVGLHSDAKERRAPCLAAIAGLLADAFGLPDVRPTPGRTLSGAPAMRSPGAVAPRLLTSNRGAAALARRLEPPSGSAVRRDHDAGSACLERSPSTTGADHPGASAAPGDPSRPTSDAR